MADVKHAPLVLSTILKDFFTSFIVESKIFTESLTEKLLVGRSDLQNFDFNVPSEHTSKTDIF